MFCHGREVLYNDGTTITSSLIEKEGIIKCKDVQECEQNIIAEATTFEIKISNNKLQFLHNGVSMLEVQKNEI